MMIILLLLLGSLLPHLSFSSIVNVDIVNGREARPHSRPYMVSVQENEEHVCGGFLISDQFVLTAAHCRESNEALTVVAGAHDLESKNEGHVRIRVKSYDKHPDFKTDSNKPFKADLMILKLQRKIKKSKNISWIPLPTKARVVKVDTVCRVAGWGRVTVNRPFSSKLREAKVKIMNNTDCEDRWGRLYIASEMMCVYGSGGTCEGDSGGPLVCDDTAVGVTSFGDKNTCNSRDRPEVYLNISEFLPWIQNKTKSAN